MVLDQLETQFQLLLLSTSLADCELYRDLARHSFETVCPCGILIARYHMTKAEH